MFRVKLLPGLALAVPRDPRPGGGDIMHGSACPISR